MQCFHGQVCNGGFSQWFGNGYFDDDLATLGRALARMEQTELVKTVSGLIDRATRIIVNDDGYDAKHHDLSDHGYDALDGLDDAYYAISEDVRAAVRRVLYDAGSSPLPDQPPFLGGFCCLAQHQLGRAQPVHMSMFSKDAFYS